MHSSRMPSLLHARSPATDTPRQACPPCNAWPPTKHPPLNHACSQRRTTSPRGQTYNCENITLPQTSFAAGKYVTRLNPKTKYASFS